MTDNPAGALPNPTGCSLIDDARRSVIASPTTPATASDRSVVLNMWHRLLVNRGVNVDCVADLVHTISDLADPSCAAAIDRGYAAFEILQAHPVFFETCVCQPALGKAGMSDWPSFQGDAFQQGVSPDPGPSQGQVAWTFPIGHAWYSAPVASDGRIYAVSPGITTTLYCCDDASGRVLWRNRQMAFQPYGTARYSSTPLVLDETVLIRGGGQRVAQGETLSRELRVVDKASGETRQTLFSAHVDYRQSHAPLSGDSRYVVLIEGDHDIDRTPPIAGAMDTVTLLELETETRLWSLRVGPIFGEALLLEDLVLVATDDGFLFALNLRGSERVRWRYRADGPLRGTPVQFAGVIYLTSESGTLHALDSPDGTLLWSTPLAPKQPRSHRLFSDLQIDNDLIYLGDAHQVVHAIERRTGRELWQWVAGDWIRSRPCAAGNLLMVASMDGKVTALRHGNGRPTVVWSQQVTRHQILANLTLSPRGLLVSSSDLWLIALDAGNGRERWRHSLLESATVDGQRFEADIPAGGADYQSSPTAVGGTVFIGGPNHFVYAVDAKTGRERWRFETSGQVSATPLIIDGLVYFGQQGGNHDFYAVNATDGTPVWTSPVGWAWIGATGSPAGIFFGTVQGQFICLDPRSGAIKWSHATLGGVYPSAPFDDNYVYAGSWDGHMFALDRRDGSLVWAYDFGRPDSGSPVLYQGRLISVSYRGFITALEASSGRVLWRFAVPEGRNVNGTSSAHNGRIYTSDYIRQGRMPLGSRILALDSATGGLIWEHPVGGGLTSPAIAGGKLFFGSTEHVYFSCVDEMGTGDGTTKLIWRIRIGGTVDESCPAIHGHRAFILASDRLLYAFE